MLRPARCRKPTLLLGGCLLVACGAEKVDAPPGASGSRGLPGTYSLDREATRAALLEAAAALEDADVRSRLGLPEDPALWAPQIRRKQESQRKLADAVTRGEIEQEFTLEADGTWTGMTRMQGQARNFAGTWEREGDRLEIVQDSPGGSSTRSCRIGDGCLEILSAEDLIVAVLKRR